MKRFSAYLLAALMLLSLCGCGQQETPDEGGTVINPPVSDPGQTPASPDSGPEAALYQKYKTIIDALENKNYTQAIHEIVVLSNADKPKEEKTPIAAWFTGDWHLNVDDEYSDSPQVLTLSDTGIIKLDGTAYNWLENGKGDTNLSGWLLKDGVHTYYLSLTKNTDHLIPYITLYTVKQSGNSYNTDKSMGTYYNDPMLGWALDSWQNLNDQEKAMPKSFSLNNTRLSMNSTDYTWSVKSRTDSTITLAIGDAYTLDVELRGTQPMATLTDKATGSTACYRTSEHGYDRSWPEYIYPEAMQYLEESVADMNNGYAPGFSSYLEGQNSIFYSGNAAMKYLYDTFTALGSYKDSAEIAARFTILEGMHTHTTRTYTDNMGNTNTDLSHELFTYNAKGQMIRGESEQLYRLYGGSEGYYKYLFYNEQGHLVQVTDGTGNNISARMELTCDAQGRPVEGSYKTNNYSGQLSYTYDAQGRLAESISWYGNSRIWSTYTYDAQGRLATIVQWTGSEHYDYKDTRYTTTYTYDDQGRLVSQVILDEYRSGSTMKLRHTTTIRSTAWDDQGRPLAADYSYVNSQGESSYASQSLNFHYDDLYFYQDYTFTFTP